MPPRRILAAALAAAAFLCAGTMALVQSAAAGPDRVQAALAIAERYWGPLCCTGGVTVTRGDLSDGVRAHASYDYPPGGEDDPSRYYHRRITVRRGHIAWKYFCTAIVHEAGHLAGWRAERGQEYVRADGTADRLHSNDPFNVMYPRLAHIFPACHGTEPAGHHSAPRQVATVRDPRPVTVLLLPGGGWQHADPATMEPWIQDFAAHGIRARAITYPLKNVIAAIDAARQVAVAEPGPVVAYGISAGGTIAAALAATGDVAGAVNIAGPTDFTRWISPAGLQIMRQIGMRTYAQKRAASPYWRLNGRQSPQLVQCGAIDPLVEETQCERYTSAARRGNPDTTLRRMLDAHHQSGTERDAAREWIVRRWGP